MHYVLHEDHPEPYENNKYIVGVYEDLELAKEKAIELVIEELKWHDSKSSYEYLPRSHKCTISLWVDEVQSPDILVVSNRFREGEYTDHITEYIKRYYYGLSVTSSENLFYSFCQLMVQRGPKTFGKAYDTKHPIPMDLKELDELLESFGMKKLCANCLINPEEKVRHCRPCWEATQGPDEDWPEEY